jgi:hypothetical protein
VARALRLRNSLRVAIQVWRGAWRRDCLRDRTAHPRQKEETGGTISVSSPSQLPRIHRHNSAHTEQSAETAFLTFPSQFSPKVISWRDEMLAASTRNGEFRNDFLRAKARPRDFSVLWTGSFAMISMRERGGTKRILASQLEARLEFELRWALRSIKSR